MAVIMKSWGAIEYNDSHSCRIEIAFNAMACHDIVFVYVVYYFVSTFFSNMHTLVSTKLM